MTASMIFVNAKVLTMGTPARAEALAVSGNTILALGSEAEIRAMAGPGTRIIDAGGATLMPGFVESHVHLFSGAYGQTLLQLADIKGFDAMKAAVQVFAAANPEAGLLFAQGADYEILGPGQRLNRHALDLMCPDRPLAVMAYDFHTLFANTAALTAAGLPAGARLAGGQRGGDGHRRACHRRTSRKIRAAAGP